MKKLFLVLVSALFLLSVQIACYSARTEMRSSNSEAPRNSQAVAEATPPASNLGKDAKSGANANSQNARRSDEKLDAELLRAVLDNDLGGVIALVEQGANVNATGDFEEIGKDLTPLNLAVSQDDEIVDVLLQNGADPNKFSDFYAGQAKQTQSVTPLMRAAQLGKTSTAKFLLANKADPNLRNKKGDTALMTAVSSADLMRLLLESGANPNLANEEGFTALMAVVSGASYDKTKPEKVRLLLEKGAKIDAKDKNGRSALDIARSYNDTQTVNLLQKAN